MSCHGMINGMRVARGLAAADPSAVVLVCAVELCSLHYRMTWINESMVGNALFADGSAAVVVAGKDAAIADAEGGTLEVLDTACVRIPESHDQMSWMMGNYGFRDVVIGRSPAQHREAPECVGR